MLSHLRHNNKTIVFALLIFLAMRPSLAHAEPSTQNSNTNSNQNTNQGTNSGGVPVNQATANGIKDESFTNAGGTLTPAQQAPPADRKSGAGAAQAAAIAGAAMAGMGCIMMMNEARKMPPGKDKTMMMMMAMQQCSQAAQSAANAAKNDDAKKAASGADIPKQASLTAPKTETKNDTLPDQAIAQASPAPSDAPLNIDDLAQTTPLDPNTIPSPNSLVDGKPMDATNFKVKEVSISALKPIDNVKVDFNENAKEGDKAINADALSRAMGGMSSGRGPASEDLKKVTSDLSGSEGTGKKKGGGGGDATGEGLSGEGGSGSKEEGGNSAFDQMLSQLMGGGAPAEQAGGFGGGDVVVLPKDKATGGGPNIFEYASYRYRTATFADGRIKAKPTVSRISLTPTTASVSKP